MLIVHDPDEWETVSSHTTCAFHQEHPGVPYAGCGCSGGYGMQRRPLADTLRIKREREAGKGAELAKALIARGWRPPPSTSTSRDPCTSASSRTTTMVRGAS